MEVRPSNPHPLGLRYSVVDFDNYPGSLQFQLHQPKDSLGAGTAYNAAMEESKPDCSGLLSVHQYRQSLWQDDESCSSDGYGAKALQRSNGASNPNQASSVSATSSPPPLSPSYSLSIASQRSEQELEVPRASSPQMAHSEFPIRRKVSNRLNTFRDRLRKPSLTRESSFRSSHTKTRSDSGLMDLKQAKATMVHQGTSFEILNPHESLNFARIVSYIEDVDMDDFSRASSDYKRESFLSASTINTKVLKSEKEIALSVEVPDNGGSETNGDHTGNEEAQVHSDLVGEPPHTPMPSISERLESNEEGASNHGLRSETPESSNLGEPGPCEEDGVVIIEPEQVSNTPKQDTPIAPKQAPSNVPKQTPSNKPEPKPPIQKRFYPEAWSLSMYDDGPASGLRAQAQAQPRPIIHHQISALTEKPKRNGAFSRIRAVIRLPFFRRKRDSLGRW